MISPNYIEEIFYEDESKRYFEVIAQHDDNDYEESGYVVVHDLVTDEYALGNYAHCSCYGTWEALSGWNWIGTKKDLIKLAKNRLDPDMPEREANPEDYDYDHLVEVYKQVLNKLKGN